MTNKYNPNDILQPTYNVANFNNGSLGMQGNDEGEFLRIRQLLNAKNALGTEYFMPVKLGDVLLPNEPSVTVASKKNIVETVLVGSTVQGSVKELVAIGDYEITIRGLAIKQDSKLYYPEREIKTLHDLYKRNESVVIVCGLTELLGISRVIITDFSLPEMIGVQHAQLYEIRCISDTDFELEII